MPKTTSIKHTKQTSADSSLHVMNKTKRVKMYNHIPNLDHLNSDVA